MLRCIDYQARKQACQQALPPFLLTVRGGLRCHSVCCSARTIKQASKLDSRRFLPYLFTIRGSLRCLDARQVCFFLVRVYKPCEGQHVWPCKHSNPAFLVSHYRKRKLLRSDFISLCEYRADHEVLSRALVVVANHHHILSGQIADIEGPRWETPSV